MWNPSLQLGSSKRYELGNGEVTADKDAAIPNIAEQNDFIDSGKQGMEVLKGDAAI
ncbi:hypothetical protein J2857_005342 [Neorhizobium galegae]|uniref:hypothetical protein n=1 Tax=Neorhizobium galegae TaxID=399 RepID=UPI001AE6253B|nr:hypothetical protein [Neorhizobium galegae]MBP2562551.1 hypothetical protein [Neorhizobium galegae]